MTFSDVLVHVEAPRVRTTPLSTSVPHSAPHGHAVAQFGGPRQVGASASDRSRDLVACVEPLIANIEFDALLEQVDAIGKERASITDGEAIDELFADVDRDGDGTISKTEFAKMYEYVKAKIEKETEETAAEHQKLAKSTRRSKMLCGMIALLIPVMLLLLFGNMGLVYTVLKLSKETDMAGNQMMARGTGSVVQMGQALKSGNLTDLLNSPLEDTAKLEYDFQGGDGLHTGLGAKVSAFEHVDAKRVTLQLTSGHLVIVEPSGSKFLPPANGAVRFTPSTGVAEFSGQAAFMVSNNFFGGGTFESRAKALCEALSCPIASCVVGTSNEVLRSTTCFGHEGTATATRHNPSAPSPQTCVSLPSVACL